MVSRTETNIENRGEESREGITVGVVVDTNDPQQMGRVRVLCKAWGDTEDTTLGDIPWAIYVTPYGGISPSMHRGPEQQYSTNPISYGMWAVPKIGAQVIVACLDGNPSTRIWLGCIYGQFLTHTIPLGRYLSEASGPFSSKEGAIEPLSTNMNIAFGNPSSPEYRTRAAEGQVSSLENLSQKVSKVGDRRNSDVDRAGYQLTRSRYDISFTNTGGNFDPQMYCLTTPGLHAIIMDDSQTNGRIRIRTTSGNQIILDDTNERIYISSAHGNNWIEMDKNGNIDIFSERRVSINAVKDINFKTNGRFRVEADGGIHLNSKNDIRISGEAGIHLKASNDIIVQSSNEIRMKPSDDFKVEAGANIQMKASAAVGIKAGSHLCIFSSSSMHLDGSTIDLNSGGNCAESIGSFTGSNSAYSVNRVPKRESWARVMVVSTDTDFTNAFQYNNSFTPELNFNNPNVGKVELGETISRNENWRR